MSEELQNKHYKKSEFLNQQLKNHNISMPCLIALAEFILPY